MNRDLEKAFREQAKQLILLCRSYFNNKEAVEAFRQGKGTSVKPIDETIADLEEDAGQIADELVNVFNDWRPNLQELFEEITANLEEPMSDSQRERYCFSLITPFEGYCDIPVKVISGENLENKDIDDTEWLYFKFANIVKEYFNMLDAVFVQFGLDLKQLQQRCGVSIKQYWGGDIEKEERAFDISKYVGSYLAKEYVNRLEPQKPPQDATETELQTGTRQEPQQGEQEQNIKPTRGRGRPKETLIEKMMDDTDGSKLQKIHKVIKGKKGKDAALVILACMEKGWMLKPTYTQVKNEFGDIGCRTGYNRYLQKERFTKEEIEGAKKSLD